MKNLASERTRLGLKQSEAASKLAVSPKTLAKYENEPTSMPGDFIIRACRFYLCNASYLLDMCEERSLNAAVAK
ncbi:MAG: helix-turn-helix transcriptional regulator [Atopobium sp.]|uniref:helix-turn-helix domain-containing protein n=1 Tax=Atopobium sp. TaxID=1872650 RepID=UPI002A801556|nr:helix-turn-helix transcriptional regulator [Atopobium sp.]MDY4522480.1 helix-turn-helix transcriptional regulator [Atopobium sp.]